MPKSSEIEGLPAGDDENLVERLDAATERLRAYTNAAVGVYTVPGAVDRLAVKQDDVYMAHYRLDEAASAISRLSTEVQELRAALPNLLTDVAQMIDTVRQEWQADGSWSEWDQSVRDRITEQLARLLS